MVGNVHLRLLDSQKRLSQYVLYDGDAQRIEDDINERRKLCFYSLVRQAGMSAMPQASRLSRPYKQRHIKVADREIATWPLMVRLGQ